MEYAAVSGIGFNGEKSKAILYVRLRGSGGTYAFDWRLNRLLCRDLSADSSLECPAIGRHSRRAATAQRACGEFATGLWIRHGERVVDMATRVV